MIFCEVRVIKMTKLANKLHLKRILEGPVPSYPCTGQVHAKASKAIQWAVDANAFRVTGLSAIDLKDAGVLNMTSYLLDTLFRWQVSSIGIVDHHLRVFKEGFLESFVIPEFGVWKSLEVTFKSEVGLLAKGTEFKRQVRFSFCRAVYGLLVANERALFGQFEEDCSFKGSGEVPETKELDSWFKVLKKAEDRDWCGKDLSSRGRLHLKY